MRRAVRRAGVHWDVEEIVSKAMAELTERLTNAPAGYPESWFSLDDEPPQTDSDKLRHLATTVARRRAYDVLRHHYVRSRLDRPPPVTHDDLEPRLWARERLKQVAEFMSTLTEEERELLATSVENGHQLSNAERVRLHRLRSRIRGLLSPPTPTGTPKP